MLKLGTRRRHISYTPLRTHSFHLLQRKNYHVKQIDALARQLDPRVKQVMASLSGAHEVVLIAGSDGTYASDIRPLVRLNVQVIAEENGKREIGSSGGGGRTDYLYFSSELIENMYLKPSIKHCSI